MVRDYRAGRCESSRAVSSHGAEHDNWLQAKAKMAECAFAIWAGADPVEVVRWEAGPDTGADVVLAGIRFDVKWMQGHGRFLIWPIRKAAIYDTKQFDAFVAVRGDGPCQQVIGWISKRQFRDKHHVAGEGHKLTFGTWYLDLAETWPLDTLADVLRGKIGLAA